MEQAESGTGGIKCDKASCNTCTVCGLVPRVPRLKGATRIVARSRPMQELLKRAARFAVNDAPVAVLGETGTGKEVVARILHANSGRSNGPFVAVNVAALPAELLESELFGHGKGAFTGAAAARQGLFEAADGGTLFLDEIGEMPLPLQAKLLRALQDGEVRRVGENASFAVNVRVVSATHRNLAQSVRAGLFREDLYYRLKVLTLEVPPLRERREDILTLARDFLAAERAASRDFSPEAQERLERYGWPGNVRELENVIKHGAALATGALIQAGDLPGELTREAELDAAPDGPPSLGELAVSAAPKSLAEVKTLAELEREYVVRVLDLCGGSHSRAARALGVARNTLWRKVRTYS